MDTPAERVVSLAALGSRFQALDEEHRLLLDPADLELVACVMHQGRFEERDPVPRDSLIPGEGHERQVIR